MAGGIGPSIGTVIAPDQNAHVFFWHLYVYVAPPLLLLKLSDAGDQLPDVRWIAGRDVDGVDRVVFARLSHDPAVVVVNDNSDAF